MREMTAPEGAVTVSKDRPNEDFIGVCGERSTARCEATPDGLQPVAGSAAAGSPRD